MKLKLKKQNQENQNSGQSPTIFRFPVDFLVFESDKYYKFQDINNKYSTWVSKTLIKEDNTSEDYFLFIFPSKPGWTFEFSLQKKTASGWQTSDTEKVDLEIFTEVYGEFLLKKSEKQNINSAFTNKYRKSAKPVDYSEEE